MSIAETPAVELVAEPCGRRWKVTAKVNGVPGFVELLNPASSGQRGKFVKQLTDKFPTVPADAIDAELVKIGTVPLTPRLADDGVTIADPLSITPANVLADAETMLTGPNLICRICDDVAVLGVSGERELALTVYLIGVSRLLTKPLAGIIRGSSSSGKSFLIERVASLFPPEAVIHATQMTPQALFHMPPGSLVHKWVVAGERSRVEDDDRAEATRALREMLSSGKLSKLMPEKGEGGKIETSTIEQEGPIAFIESTTLATVFEEDANRCLLLVTDERDEQTRRIISQIAMRHSSPQVDRAEDVRAVHHALQRILPSLEVRVPYADRIGERFGCERVEVRRAFPQLLALIQASALLHFRQRETASDGALLANDEDYQIARRLISRPFALSLGGGVCDSAIQFFEKLKGWAPMEFTVRKAVKQCSAGKSAVYGWLSELHDAGAVEEVEQARGRKAAKWRLTGSDPLPGAGIIPEVGDIFPEHRIRGHKEAPLEQQGE
jgi:hypothetical protein